MRHLGPLATLLCATAFGFSVAAEPPQVQAMSASSVAHAQSMEAQVRHEFLSEVGHEATTSNELLLLLDGKTLHTETLGDKAKDDLVQEYGATLGQLVIKEFGGSWVVASSGQGDSMGVELPVGKVAFVFNRAARRIFDADPIGFHSYFESVASLVHGTPLPNDVETHRVR